MCDDGRYALRDGLRLVLYVSTPPCEIPCPFSNGPLNICTPLQAGMRPCASWRRARRANGRAERLRGYAPVDPTAAARGRDNYALWGDKIAAWGYLGIQGALGSRFMRPLYIHSVLIGEVPSALRPAVEADCARALWGRLAGIADSGAYTLHAPTIHFTAVPFFHSRSATPRAGGSCNESLWWIADSSKPAEVLINGYKRGVAPRHRHRDRSRPQACRKSALQLYHETLRLTALPPEPYVVQSHKSPPPFTLATSSDSATYFAVKHSMAEYQAAKQALMGGLDGPFRGWIRGPAQQDFNAG
ncbi:adenosine deaminase/editase [Mycena rosella]|uniref:Adenosine deaminase/editase n=1 Tax=Mycena rosella TaxID=1033263 RepID=A0AAD7DD06_MYCRO|nr:adenosine deaminase/editase [Mycena rosella]